MLSWRADLDFNITWSDAISSSSTSYILLSGEWLYALKGWGLTVMDVHYLQNSPIQGIKYDLTSHDNLYCIQTQSKIPGVKHLCAAGF